MAQRLKSITLRGFKTIRELKDFQPRAITVLIGPNGAGKSNFISFFRLLSWALVPPGQLQEHVAKLGGASAILYDGPEQTRGIEAHLVLTTDADPILGAPEENEYSFHLAYAAGDTLIYTEEKYRSSRSGGQTEAPWTIFTAGNREPELIKAAEVGATIPSTVPTKTKGFVRRVAEIGRARDTARTILALLQKLIVHQFHDTSEGSRLRQKWSIDDSRWLKEDAGNLAPFLYRLQQQFPKYYARILETIRLILPFFAEFELKPEFGKVLLAWRERGTDRVFTASQAADGMLRIMALVALLEQPESDLPDVVILDEPELGLHPYAIEVLAGLIRSASQHAQVILATQSVSLVDRFTPEDIVVVNRTARESTLQRYTEAELHAWLEEYTFSELWEKNVIGGRPS
ncbi:MAG: AAA family ATPase [Terriglobia bacterium]|jgi:predicted ATPase